MKKFFSSVAKYMDISFLNSNIVNDFRPTIFLSLKFSKTLKDFFEEKFFQKEEKIKNQKFKFKLNCIRIGKSQILLNNDT